VNLQRHSAEHFRRQDRSFRDSKQDKKAKISRILSGSAALFIFLVFFSLFVILYYSYAIRPDISETLHFRIYISEALRFRSSTFQKLYVSLFLYWPEAG
jgi:hypothetical protein